MQLIGGYELFRLLFKISVLTIHVEFQRIFLYKCNRSAVIPFILNCVLFLFPLRNFLRFGGSVQASVFGLKNKFQFPFIDFFFIFCFFFLLR